MICQSINIIYIFLFWFGPNKMIDINNYENELLLSAGYSEKEIANMTLNQKRSYALEIEMELEAIEASL